MKQAQFDIVREKIETIPWHPAAPSITHQNPTMPKNCYFETHFGILTTKNRLDELRQIAKETNSHLSRNAFKTFDDGTFTIMMTHRNYDTVYENFKETVEDIHARLSDHRFHTEKVITEFSVFDTKVSHDSVWISKSD